LIIQVTPFSEKLRSNQLLLISQHLFIVFVFLGRRLMLQQLAKITSSSQQTISMSTKSTTSPTTAATTSAAYVADCSASGAISCVHVIT
jgi:hypothetical protein